MNVECFSGIFDFFKRTIDGYDEILPKAKANSEVCEILFGIKGDSLFTSKAWTFSCKRRRPLILRYFKDGDFNLSLIDGKWEKKCKKEDLNEMGYVSFVSCCGRLVLLESFDQCLVFDPLSQERITMITLPAAGWGAPPLFRPCALFYHPLAKEYRILAVRKKEKTCYEYRLYLFHSNVWRRTYNPNFVCGPREELMNTNPAIVHECLHWYIGRIELEVMINNPTIAHESLHSYTGGRVMMFNIIDEKFVVVPLPFEGCYQGDQVLMRDILVMDDQHLCLCHVGYRKRVMDIWVLEKYKEWDWIKKYTINLDWDMYKYPMENRYLVGTLGTLIVISICEDELVLFWRYRGLFSYHLRSNEIQKLYLRKTIVDKWDSYFYRDDHDYRKFCGYVAYTGR